MDMQVNVGRCEFSQFLVWDVNVYYIVFLHVSSLLFSLQSLRLNQPPRLKKTSGTAGSLWHIPKRSTMSLSHWFIAMNEKEDMRIFLPAVLCHPQTRLPSSPQCSFGFFSYLFVQWWENGWFVVAHKSEVTINCRKFRLSLQLGNQPTKINKQTILGFHLRDVTAILVYKTMTKCRSGFS